MTPADLARQNAISFECKKDTLRQNQSGDWKIAFTVQGLDMDERLTKAFPGTRYMAVLVEVGADEIPVHQPAKEVMPNSGNLPTDNAKPQPDKPQSAGAKRIDWRDVQPAAQAGIRCNEPTFWAFLREVHHYPDVKDSELASIAVRHLCTVSTRAELGTNHKARVLWHQLDAQFSAWKALEHA